jgi:hypothetical protein
LIGVVRTALNKALKEQTEAAEVQKFEIDAELDKQLGKIKTQEKRSAN